MYSGKHHAKTGARSNGNRTQYHLGQAENIALKLREQASGSNHGNGYPSASEIDRKMRARVTLRWFSFEAEGAHRYRKADSKIILGGFDNA